MKERLNGGKPRPLQRIKQNGGTVTGGRGWVKTVRANGDIVMRKEIPYGQLTIVQDKNGNIKRVIDRPK